MSTTRWNVTFQVYRQKGQEAPHYDEFKMEVDPEEYVLDGVERIWAFHDRTLCFRHACHHSTCGACGMRVNGVEKLTCITLIREVTADGGTIRVDPLRNFPVVSDLAVDMDLLFLRNDLVKQAHVLPDSEAAVEVSVKRPRGESLDGQYMRLSDCIECGLCISACPIAATTPAYLGPAVLAAAQQNGLDRMPELLEIVDCEDGVWRCHSAYECSAVCPSNVDPGWRIMDLRKQVVAQRLRALFGSR
jgi:succinate dehydrogenase/fumarate reductase iron-sulfur protein